MTFSVVSEPAYGPWNHFGAATVRVDTVSGRDLSRVPRGRSSTPLLCPPGSCDQVDRRRVPRLASPVGPHLVPGASREAAKRTSWSREALILDRRVSDSKR